VIWASLIIGLVAIERLAELSYANRNTRKLLAYGGYEIGRKHYPLIVALHTLWLITVYLAAPRGMAPVWGLILIYLALQGLRYWAIVSLRGYWTTRIITVPGAALVKRGPYRFLRHPNYIVVVAEIALLPLAFHEPWVALIFSLLNATLLWRRIRIENGTLDARR
jgi:methyltransferase